MTDLRGERVDEGKVWAACPRCARYRELVDDAIELAEEGWGYVGEDSYFYTKYYVKERLEELRRRKGEG